jgi:alpha-glucosidase
VMRFWLDKGVAGFRLDAIPSLFEDPKLRDEPATGGTNAFGDPNIASNYVDNLPEVHGVIRRMRAMVNKYPGDRVLIGETYLKDVHQLDVWYGGAAKNELQLPMDLHLGFGEGVVHGKMNADFFRNAIGDAETQLQGSEPLLVFSNHDNPRDWDRLGDGKHNDRIAKIIATMLLTTHDTALMYYGEELGMHTQTPTRIQDVQDPVGRTGWPKEKGRDGERTPMQWTPGPQAGFSTNPHTWLPIQPNYKERNVETEQGQPDSLLRWYEELIQLREQDPAFANDAKFTMIEKTAPNVLAYERRGSDGSVVVVAMNMGDSNANFDTASWVKGGAALQTMLAANAPGNSVIHSPQVTLPSLSVWIARVTN